MWIDLNKVEATPFNDKYDVCVCGSGPAGMAVTQSLMAKGARVLLLEAGDVNPTPESQRVYEAKSVGPIEYYGVEFCRLRYFGGTSNHWTGRCGLFDPMDFGEREIWDVPGWPISYDEAYSHLDDAMAFLDLAPGSLQKPNEPGWKKERFFPSAYAISPPTRVGEKYRASLEASSNVDVALNANVTDILLDEGGTRASKITVENYAGGKFDISADYFVLAFGALENARFLLNARSQNPSGLGNQSDMVGRCFMEHFDLELGRFIPTTKDFWDRDESLPVNPTEKMANEKNIGNSIMTLQANGRPKFYGRLAPLRKMQRSITCSSDYLLRQARSKEDILCDGDGRVSTLMEQTPNRNSRVFLDDTAQDQFGKHRLQLNWEINDQDRKTIKTLAEELGKTLAVQKLARFKIADKVLDGSADLGFHCHQMGTTRMSSNPNVGVVDANCRVHGVDNLFMGGSSVFSTGGGMNPTLTLTALAMRLGDHLGQKLNLS